MGRNQSSLWRRVELRVRQVGAVAHRWGTILLLIAMFLSAAVLPTVLPTLAHVATDQPISQNASNPEALVERGKTLYEAERFAEAAAVLQQAVNGFIPGDVRQAIALSNLSLAYQQLGQWPQAEQAIATSLALLGYSPIQNPKSKIQNLQILAQALDVKGQLQLAKGQAETALTTWQQATSIYAQLGDRNAVTRDRINQAQALQTLGLYLQAQKSLTQLQQIQNQPDSLLKATELRSLGNVLRVVGNLSESRQVLEQSLKVAQALRSPPAISEALLNLGNTARAQQDTQAALTYYQQAATTSPTLGIQAQLNQLSLLLETQQSKAATALWPQIQSAIANLPPSRTAVYARINFAQSLMKLGRWGDGEMGRWGDGEVGRWGGREKLTPNSELQTPNSELRTPHFS